MPDDLKIKAVLRLKEELKNNPNVNLCNFNIPLTNNKKTPRLKDILDENVPEEYFLNEDFGIDLSKLDQKGKRGNIKFLFGIGVPRYKGKGLSREFKEGNRIHSIKGISPTLRASQGGYANGSQLILIPQTNTDSANPILKVRKMTPSECESVQGYPKGHTEFGRKQDGSVYKISNNQRYKMCGNGVSSPVSKHILETLIPDGEKLKVMSTFSGCGGTELLLSKRFKVIYHSEFNRYASDVLRFHHPNIVNLGDITKINETSIKDFDLFIGGFPCHSWSISGLRQGFDDEKGRGQLIYDVFRILKTKKPKYFLLENVKGLINHNKGQSFIAILEFLSKIGYDIDFEVVNSKNFGLAQNRERVFIFGKLKTLPQLNKNI